jgi:hypothetical protein
MRKNLLRSCILSLRDMIRLLFRNRSKELNSFVKNHLIDSHLVLLICSSFGAEASWITSPSWRTTTWTSSSSCASLAFFPPFQVRRLRLKQTLLETIRRFLKVNHSHSLWKRQCSNIIHSLTQIMRKNGAGKGLVKHSFENLVTLSLLKVLV